MWLAGRLPCWLPGGTGLRNRLVGTSLILTPELESEGFRRPIGELDQVFLGVACGSMVCTTVPSLRWRRAVPVWHQVRFCWKV